MAKTENRSTDQTSFTPPATADTAVTAADVAKKELPPVKLSTAHDFTLAERALTDRTETLKAIAKKTREEGYEKEARAIEADAAAIEHRILPQLRNQRELPLVSSEQFEKEVAEAIRVIIFRAFDSLDDPKSKVTADGIRGRRDRLIEGLASRVMLYARDVAGAAWDAGYQARTRTPDVIASSVVSTLCGGRAD